MLHNQDQNAKILNKINGIHALAMLELKEHGEGSKKQSICDCQTMESISTSAEHTSMWVKAIHFLALQDLMHGVED